MCKRIGLGLAALAAALTLTTTGAWAASPSGLGLNGPPIPQRSDCDPLDPAACLLPFPNDYFTTPDRGMDTGLRLDIAPTATPANSHGVHIDPSAFNRNDGYAPGQVIVTHVPGLDSQQAFDNTGAVPIDDLARSFDSSAPIVVINAQTHRRQLIWAELDSQAANPANVDLLIHPAVDWSEGGHYIVAMRNLKDASGNTIPAQEAFRDYRDGVATNDPVFEARRPHMEWIFDRLHQAGIARSNLYLAWDFTVASERNLSERALAVRNDAFAQLGDTKLGDMKVQGGSPAFSVTSETDFTPDQNSKIAREILGSFTVPCYLDKPGCPPGSSMSFKPGTNIPQQLPGNVVQANFDCIIPRSAVDAGPNPARPSLYGHGLFGSASEVHAGNVQDMANEHNFVFCATNWSGMANDDLPNALSALQDLSTFNTLPDRMQQAYVNFMYLGRLMIHPNGLSSNPAFQLNGQSLIDRTRLFYDGNSQGGIEGGALTALAPDFDHAVLGVPGMNYSLLIQRSVDFDPFGAILNPSYPSEIERPLIISLLEVLWTRGDADGYAQHMTDNPYPDTPRHKVLLEMAFGDHQVTNWATEVEARTIGARLRTPAVFPGRSPEKVPYFGIPAINQFPFNGSALVVWDIGPTRTVGSRVFGTDPPPLENQPDRGGVDPHGAPRSDVENRVQKSDFLQVNGKVVDVCGSGPCFTGGFTGP
ncbi:MAG TPA: hypothetical protein VFL87_06790 [Thermoleophilaceae bacterium]|nr:hypothetical protein [Thermoleophilaceae bacterium]